MLRASTISRTKSVGAIKGTTQSQLGLAIGFCFGLGAFWEFCGAPFTRPFKSILSYKNRDGAAGYIKDGPNKQYL